MNKLKNEARAQTAEPSLRLLKARAKEIKVLREDVAGWQESTRLATAFMALLSLALSGEEAAREGVRVLKSDTHTNAVAINKQALGCALGKWQADIEQDEAEYRILFASKSPTV